MDSGNRAHNHWFPVTQVQKNSVLQVAVSDEDACNTNGKSTFTYALKPLLLLSYPTNTITRTHIPLETSCLTWFST